MKYSLGLFLLLWTMFCACDKRPADHFVEINGKKQHVLTLGEGKPIVVFLAGSGSNLTHFDSVQRAISKITRTISYDKPGLGKSEMINTPRTIENLTDEVNQILTKEGAQNGMILVGHSLGGDIARYFIHLYPEKVVGMVLIDPGDEYLFDEVMKTKTEKDRRFVDSLIAHPDKSSPIGAQMEAKYYHRHDSLLRTFQINTRMPITLIESNKVVEDEMMTADVIEIKKRLFRELQKKVPQMKIVSTDKSGHFIQLSEPNLVIDEIKLMIESLK